MLTLHQKLLESLMMDPRMAAAVLMGWDIDEYQGAALKLDWWFPDNIDSSGVSTGKTLRIFILSCLRAMMIDDQVVSCYFPVWSVGQRTFWPYFATTMRKSEIFRKQLTVHRNQLGEHKPPSCWWMEFKNHSKIEMPAPGFTKNNMSQASIRVNTLIVDDWLRAIEMGDGDGIATQLYDRATRPSFNPNHPVWCNHIHLKGHAQRPSHKGYERYQSYRKLIANGSHHHAVYSFCYKDISEKFAQLVRPDKVIQTQKASLPPDQFSRQWLGLWARDGATFYPEGVIARGARVDLHPELARSSDGCLYVAGVDVAPGQSVKADYCAMKVMRLRPVSLAELPMLIGNKNRFIRVGQRVWEKAFVFGWGGRNLSAQEIAWIIHFQHARFRFARIVMDPGGGGQWVRAELRNNECRGRRVMPICTRDEPNFHDKQPILHLFKRGGELDHLPFVAPEMLAGDDGFLAAYHLRYREGWELGQIGYPLPLAARDPKEIQGHWSHELIMAQKTIEEGMRQICKVRQQTDEDGRPLISKRGFSLFHSPIKKDVAYAGLYANAAAEMLLVGDDSENEDVVVGTN